MIPKLCGHFVSQQMLSNTMDTIIVLHSPQIVYNPPILPDSQDETYYGNTPCQYLERISVGWAFYWGVDEWNLICLWLVHGYPQEGRHHTPGHCLQFVKEFTLHHRDLIYDQILALQPLLPHPGSLSQFDTLMYGSLSRTNTCKDWGKVTEYFSGNPA